MNEFNPVPGIEFYNNNLNPTMRSDNSIYEISLFQTRETLQDIEVYKSFLSNIERQFRSSVRYTKYKSFLYGLGYDKCQIHGYINSEMASIEMHHAILTLYDLCLLITEYYLNTVGYVTTFDVIKTLKDEHAQNNVALVMLTETAHQVYHNDSSFYIHPSMCFGKWPVLLKKYREGLTQDLAFKILYYLKKSENVDGTIDNGLFDIRESILDWSEKNGI